MMLDHLGESKAAAAVVKAIEDVLGERTLRTRDLGGNVGSEIAGKAIAATVG
jgi:tartrate dehydrogenase/decarboxylase / D-malate dehydrogenase